MNPKILDPEVQDFIFEKAKDTIDMTKFILAGSPFKGITVQELAQQIQGKYKTKNKLPLWNQTKNIYYSPTLNLEQTSSETTAVYKSNLVAGHTLIDLTGGFGIDTYYFSEKIAKIIHCELNTELSSIAAHNFKTLGVDTIETKTGNGLEILEEQKTVDWIYIDPSRRHGSKGKVFFLEDCLPNVPEHIELLYNKSTHILIKTSPLLDIHAGIRSLQGVKEIHVVAVQNEVKELLWVLEKEYTRDVTMHSVDLRKESTHQFSFTLDEESTNTITYALPKRYIYEPNATILKAGGFISVAVHYELEKLHAHSHLYTSDTKIDFPGRCFEVQKVLPYQKKTLKQEKIQKANITTRNFPESVAEIRKKHTIKDGGDLYLFFTTDYTNNKIVLVCKKC